mmetsp:Transcript_18065/g.44257  ORF Transcript_18065/g.44257 Transcript_18065/m.44257 type:complete len:152 (-) Transcript_18065:1496-1951(-)
MDLPPADAGRMLGRDLCHGGLGILPRLDCGFGSLLWLADPGGLGIELIELMDSENSSGDGGRSGEAGCFAGLRDFAARGERWGLLLRALSAVGSELRPTNGSFPGFPPSSSSSSWAPSSSTLKVRAKAMEGSEVVVETRGFPRGLDEERAR